MDTEKLPMRDKRFLIYGTWVFMLAVVLSLLGVAFWEIGKSTNKPHIDTFSDRYRTINMCLLILSCGLAIHLIAHPLPLRFDFRQFTDINYEDNENEN